MTMARHLAITMGDPAGIGPEIIVKAAARCATGSRRAICALLVIGSGAALDRRSAQLGLGQHIPEVGDGECDWPTSGSCKPDPEGEPIRPGTLSADGGRFAFKAVEQACASRIAGRIDAIVTAPLNKEALNMAGYHYAGHTEMLAELTGVRGLGDDARARQHARQPRHDAHRAGGRAEAADAGAAAPRHRPDARSAARPRHRARRRIAVAALNPHAGEGGLFGRQDIDVSDAGDCRGRRRRDSTWSGRCRATRCSSSCAPASTTRWSRCTTTRGTSRSSCSASRSIRRPAHGGRCRA